MVGGTSDLSHTLLAGIAKGSVSDQAESASGEAEASEGSEGSSEWEEVVGRIDMAFSDQRHEEKEVAPGSSNVEGEGEGEGESGQGGGHKEGRPESSKRVLKTTVTSAMR